MRPTRILIADDDEAIVELCRRVLATKGYEVKAVSSGEKAVKLAFSEQFHLLLIDMAMSGINGLETFLAIKEIQHEIVGVLMTGHGTMDTAIKAMKFGFSAFIKKPFALIELVQVIEDSLHKSALMEENTRLKTLIPLYQLGEKFLTSRSIKEILNELIQTVSIQTGAQRISAMLYDEGQGCLRIAAAIGVREETVRKSRIKPGETIAGRVFQRGEPIILNSGPESNSRIASFLESKNIIAAVSFPLKSRDKTLGVLNISKVGTGTPFSKADIEMLSVICGQAVMALDNLKIMDERAEKVRVRTLLEQYMAPEVAEVLISHGQNPMEVGEIKDITVLFADIRNFTPLVEHLPLETLRSFLNDFFDLLTEVIFRFKGTLDKFMGDATLSFFGAPIPLGEPQNAAVSAAVEILRKFSELKTHWKSKKQPFDPVGLGIGITSGEMFLGNVGSQKRFDYTVIGTDVNLAQRLASEAESGEILIGKSVKDRLDSRFRITRESLRLLRGLENPIPVFSITGE
jgi:adenylate cyclase